MAKVFNRMLDSNRDGYAFEKEENGDSGSARCLRLDEFIYEFFPPKPGSSECRLYRYGSWGRRAGMKVLPAPSLKKRVQLLINFIKKAHREWGDEQRSGSTTCSTCLSMMTAPSRRASLLF